MRLPEEPEPPLSINIVPMIDVIFAILAFLIISTLFLTRSQGLPVNLPNATTAKAQNTEQVNLTITEDGKIYLNRQQVELGQLNGSLNSLIKPDSSPLVLVNADTEVNHGKVVQVMDILRQIQGIRLAIAVTQKDK